MYFEIKLIKVTVAQPMARRKQYNRARGTESTDDNTTHITAGCASVVANTAQRKRDEIRINTLQRTGDADFRF